MENVEANKLCVIEYDSMTHLNAAKHCGDIMVIVDRWRVYSLSRCVHTLDQVELHSRFSTINTKKVT